MTKGKEFPFKTLERIAIVFGVLAIGSLIFCIYIFSTRTTALHSNASIDSNIWANLGTLISGLVGSVFSIVTVLLLYMAYKAQKSEMEATRQVMLDQSKALNIQQFENTFFKLLDNHSKIFKNLEVNIPTIVQLDELARTHKAKMEHYKFYMLHKKICTVRLFNYHPFHDRVFENEVIVKIINDINHISNFIISKPFLNEADRLFYFSTLFYALADSEKYFYGAQLSLGIERFITKISEQINSTYNDYYNKLEDRFKIKYSDSKYFYPTLGFAHINNKEDLNVQFTDIPKKHPIAVLTNTNGDDIRLSEISIMDSGKIKTENSFEIKNKTVIVLKPDEEYRIDLFDFINIEFFEKKLEGLIQECLSDNYSRSNQILNEIETNKKIKSNFFVLKISIKDHFDKEFEYFAEFFIRPPQNTNHPFTINIKDWYNVKLVQDILSMPELSMK